MRQFLSSYVSLYMRAKVSMEVEDEKKDNINVFYFDIIHGYIGCLYN